MWSEINSLYEGNFLERLATGSFRKTIAERGPTGTNQVRCLFQHGFDYVVGDKPLGQFRDLREDGDTGVFYSVPLLDTSYNRDLIPGLEAGVYGASFRFRVVREKIVEEPEPSDFNPKGLPERTITEVQLMEGGPVTFGAYKEATAGLRMRSLTDDFMLDKLARDPERLRALVEQREARIASDAPEPDVEAEDPADAEGESRDDAPSEEPVPATTPKPVIHTDYLGRRVKPSWVL